MTSGAFPVKDYKDRMFSPLNRKFSKIDNVGEVL